MRSSIVKVIIPTTFVLICVSSHALDTSAEEATCASIGFKRKTEAFADCVIELTVRKDDASSSNNPDDEACRKYGFKPKTSDYASCRMQIDFAKQESKRLQLKDEEQQRQYAAQLKEYQRQKDIQANMALLQLGLGMMAGSNSVGGASSVAPVPPTSTLAMPRTYILPGNKVMTCTTTGTITNCY